MLGLSCSTQDLPSSLQHVGSLVVAYKLLAVVCCIKFPDQGCIQAPALGAWRLSHQTIQLVPIYYTLLLYFLTQCKKNCHISPKVYIYSHVAMNWLSSDNSRFPGENVIGPGWGGCLFLVHIISREKESRTHIIKHLKFVFCQTPWKRAKRQMVNWEENSNMADRKKSY